MHFHLLVLDGAYRRDGEGRLRFVPVPASGTAELQGLVQRITERIGRSLERSGLITRDIENAYLAFDPGEEAPIDGLLGASITYRIATHVIFEPEDFIARLAALVPKPRANLTRYHGVFAPASPDRSRVVPKMRAAAEKSDERGEAATTDRQRALTWAQRLKRVFAIDIETCQVVAGSSG